MHNALKNNVAFGWGELAMVSCRKRDRVFPPGTLEVGEPTFAVQNVRWGFGEGAETATRGACAPRIARFHTARRKIAHAIGDRADVVWRRAAAPTHQIEPAVC